MSVKVEIFVHNLELSDRLNDYVTKKVSKINRYLDVIEEAKVDLSYAKSARSANDRQVAQITVRGKGVLLRAEERTDDIFASVDAVLDKLHRQIERYKGKHWKNRGDGRKAKEVAQAIEPLPSDTAELTVGDMIVRRKQFFLTPMDEREAVEQMALLDHEDFFVFLNVDTNQVNVLYRRLDGKLGLIESEIA
ncbi:MAG: ribosome-associated translation inhibitor RaiA [Anaerolineales bacterium]|nr:ribosome-associated translation inhibitor RaiA [Anaerolineales bacterium]